MPPAHRGKLDTTGTGRVRGESMWADLGGRTGCRLGQGQSWEAPAALGVWRTDMEVGAYGLLAGFWNFFFLMEKAGSEVELHWGQAVVGKAARC